MTTPATAELIERLSELAEKFINQVAIPVGPGAILALCAAAKLGLDAKENAK